MDSEPKKAKAPVTAPAPASKTGIDLVLSRLEFLLAEVSQLSDKLDDALSILAELQVNAFGASPSGIDGNPWSEEFEYKDDDDLL